MKLQGTCGKIIIDGKELSIKKWSFKPKKKSWKPFKKKCFTVKMKLDKENSRILKIALNTLNFLHFWKGGKG